jgi:hypothetical protein
MATLRPDEPRPRRMTEQEISSIVDKLADVARVLGNADPNDKSEIFCQLGLRLTYHRKEDRGSEDGACSTWDFESVRGGLEPGKR